MEEDIYLDKLDRRGIKPTAIRLLVIKAMMQAERAVSLLDLGKYCSIQSINRLYPVPSLSSCLITSYIA